MKPSALRRILPKLNCRKGGAVTKPVPDKAEVTIEYPDKVYMGTFESTARYDAHLDEAGVSITLRAGAADTRKSVHIHLHWALFSEILRDMAKAVSSLPAADATHRADLCDGTKALYRALTATAEGEPKDSTKLTPEDDVRLMHIME